MRLVPLAYSLACKRFPGRQIYVRRAVVPVDKEQPLVSGVAEATAGAFVAGGPMGFASTNKVSLSQSDAILLR